MAMAADVRQGRMTDSEREVLDCALRSIENVAYRDTVRP